MCSGGSPPQKNWLCEPWSLGQLGELQWRLAKEKEKETADQGCWTRFLHPTSRWLHSGQQALTSWQAANIEMVMEGRFVSYTSPASNTAIPSPGSHCETRKLWHPPPICLHHKSHVVITGQIQCHNHWRHTYRMLSTLVHQEVTVRDSYRFSSF